MIPDVSLTDSGHIDCADSADQMKTELFVKMNICRQTVMPKTDGNIIIAGSRNLETLSPCKLAFFGGSFNPPHSGHLNLVERTLKKYVDYVVFCPHSHNPQKTGTLVNMNHRIEMISLLIKDSIFKDKLFIMSPSFINGLLNKRFMDLAKYLSMSDCGVWVLCGSDTIDSMHGEMVGSLPHVIHKRGGNTCAFGKHLTNECHVIRSGDMSSSTVIREKVRRGKKHPNPEIHCYIVKNDLYGLDEFGKSR